MTCELNDEDLVALQGHVPTTDSVIEHRDQLLSMKFKKLANQEHEAYNEIMHLGVKSLLSAPWKALINQIKELEHPQFPRDLVRLLGEELKKKLI